MQAFSIDGDGSYIVDADPQRLQEYVAELRKSGLEATVKEAVDSDGIKPWYLIELINCVNTLYLKVPPVTAEEHKKAEDVRLVAKVKKLRISEMTLLHEGPALLLEIGRVTACWASVISCLIRHVVRWKSFPIGWRCSTTPVWWNVLKAFTFGLSVILNWTTPEFVLRDRRIHTVECYL